MTALAEAFARLDAFVARRRSVDGTPGVAVALTDRERTLRVATYGDADQASGSPVTPATLFEIGSIGKSFTAMLLLQLRAAGAIDLDAPVSRYLPWFAVRSAHGPILLRHLLSHTGGIIRGTDAVPDARLEVWQLRETETGGPPGKRFHYSNVAYKALGLVLERLLDRPYAEIVKERILDPLGMTESAPAISHGIRPRLAVGHQPLADDRPHWPGQPLAPATWLETDTADGCISATPGDLTIYLRMLLNRGAESTGTVLSAENFARMTAPAIEESPGVGYGLGLATQEVDGHACLGHGGSMVGYLSDLYGDLDSGFGAVAFVNGPGRPGSITRYAVELLRAVAEGRPLPDLPVEEDRRVVADADRYAGVYRTGKRTLTVVARGDALSVVTPDGALAPLRCLGKDAFLVDHPDFERFPLGFGRNGEQVVYAWHGADWYAGDAYTGPTAFEVPDGWAAYPGHYRSHNPWGTNFRVLLRRGQLWIIDSGGIEGVAGEEALVPMTPGLFRIGDDAASPERLRFDAIVDGRSLRAIRSGAEYARFFTD